MRELLPFCQLHHKTETQILKQHFRGNLVDINWKVSYDPHSQPINTLWGDSVKCKHPINSDVIFVPGAPCSRVKTASTCQVLLSALSLLLPEVELSALYIQ